MTVNSTTPARITYAALRAANRDRTLAAWLAVMSPRQRVEAAEVIAANSRRSVADALGLLGRLMDEARDAEMEVR
jgi:FixJ family two-component response regulator